MSDNVNVRKDKIFDFMAQVEDSNRREQYERDSKNSMHYKVKCLNQERKSASDKCINYILVKMYTNSLPFEDEYKSVHTGDLQKDVDTFITSMSNGKGVSSIIDNVAHPNHPISKLKYIVENYLNGIFKEATEKIAELNPEDLDFKLDDDRKKQLDDISRALSLDDVANVIKTNVKMSIDAESDRANREQKETDEIQEILSNDESVLTESDVQKKLTFIQSNKATTYTPSLMQGIMINKFNHNQDNTVLETGSDELPVAYFEAVREYTLHNVFKATRLAKYSGDNVTTLSRMYASE